MGAGIRGAACARDGRERVREVGTRGAAVMREAPGTEGTSGIRGHRMPRP